MVTCRAELAVPKERSEKPLIFDNFFTVDGVDGVGKSVMVEALRRSLQKRYPEQEVVVVSITKYLKKNRKLKNLKNAFSIAKGQEKLSWMQNIYLAAWNRIMLMIEKKLKQGKVVIMDSSPLRSVAFYQGVDQNLQSIAQTRWNDGTITRFILPRVAILLTASVDLVQQRLETRSARVRKSSNDPINREQTEIRAQAYAEKFQQLYVSLSDQLSQGGGSIFTRVFDVSDDGRLDFETGVAHYQEKYVEALLEEKSL